MRGWRDVDLLDYTVVAVVEALARQLVADPFKVELVDVGVWLPIRGLVGWDGSSWRVLVDGNALKGWSLCHGLLHELGHVVKGHVSRRWRKDADRDRLVMEGRLDDQDRLDYFQGLADGRHSEQEQEATAWADDQVDRWWALSQALARELSRGTS